MKKRDLTRLSVHIEQGILLIPLLYILTVSGSNYQVMEYNFITFTFDLGISLMSRVILLMTSLLYRLSRNEVIVYFFLAVLSLLTGILATKTILHKRKQKKNYYRIILCFLLSDLVLRILPLRFNKIIDPRIEIFSFIFRTGVLWMMIREERRYRNENLD